MTRREWNPIAEFEALLTEMMKGVTYAQFPKAPIPDADIMDIAIGVIM